MFVFCLSGSSQADNGVTGSHQLPSGNQKLIGLSERTFYVSVTTIRQRSIYSFTGVPCARHIHLNVSELLSQTGREPKLNIGQLPSSAIPKLHMYLSTSTPNLHCDFHNRKRAVFMLRAPSDQSNFD